MRIAHFYHVYADGAWEAPVTDHFCALAEYGLLKKLDACYVGFVGTPENIAAVRPTIEHYAPNYLTCAVEANGWEQVTLDKLYEYSQTHDGLVSYAHTKGAANYAAINNLWRRSMEYYNFVLWQTPVDALTEGNKSIVGCHWFTGGVASNPAFGTGGMFGGNYWWTRCELLRQNCPPDNSSRHAAEHWLGQLSEVMPITHETICDLNPRSISPENLVDRW